MNPVHDPIEAPLPAALPPSPLFSMFLYAFCLSLVFTPMQSSSLASAPVPQNLPWQETHWRYLDLKLYDLSAVLTTRHHSLLFLGTVWSLGFHGPIHSALPSCLRFFLLSLLCWFSVLCSVWPPLFSDLSLPTLHTPPMLIALEPATPFITHTLMGHTWYLLSPRLVTCNTKLRISTWVFLKFFRKDSSKIKLLPHPFPAFSVLVPLCCIPESGMTILLPVLKVGLGWSSTPLLP